MRPLNFTRINRLKEVLAHGSHTESELLTLVGMQTTQRKSLYRYLVLLRNLGEAEKTSDGKWTLTSHRSFASPAELEIHQKHWLRVVKYGLGGLIMDFVHPVIWGHSESLTDLAGPRHSATISSEPLGNIPTAQIAWLPEDSVMLEEFATENWRIALNDPNDVDRIIREQGEQLSVKPLAEQHLRTGYSTLYAEVEETKAIQKNMLNILNEVPSMFFLSQRYSDLPRTTLQRPKDQLEAIKPSTEPPRSTIEFLPRPGRQPTPKQIAQVEKLAEQAQSEVERRTRLLYKTLAEFRILREKIRNGQFLAGACDACPNITIEPHSPRSD